VAKELGDNGDNINVGAFQRWVDSNMPRSRMMFSKRVAHWLDATFEGRDMCKPTVMERAVKDASIDEIAANAEPFREMLAKMKILLGHR
jgi:hypothetical protein